ncbi:glucosaminyl-phosphotidylinositol O-acyltransferase NDAI_0G05510 [Naumovozyma dairenensis CBS 421]|uniref:GPI-anchored wall transfer protein n=1 Tax=Naumovozyma dairenensis (strain ATCC 10597 / BCRC 20456 / CBS 421 / NBRC 0211 / NRRL Y-12639) TaxID=1071378 RepID=J7REJ4_NAUDC|nr:hypothetical protein NDAI_0G05510 [Naumovozyma dairenensis CBS 421]CCK73534.1 hypothetical protein NDAI_0G05510 [Naumovozyma dairenensis CBS 421]
MSTLKQRKEDFVSGLDGGPMQEINIVTSISLTAYFCWNLLQSVNNEEPLNPILDFSLNWIPLLLSITSYSNDIGLLTLLLLLPCVSIFIYQKFILKQQQQQQQKTKLGPKASKNEEDPLSFKLMKQPYITAYRSGMLILTTLAILAVDFPIFPRRFAKVETWGTSLMDLGVGSFVFSNGIVSSRSILKNKMQSSKPHHFLRNTFNAFKSGVSLLILGLLRLYFVKNLEYQEHVTEYGVHWNFFITLSLLPPTLAILDPLTKWIPHCVIAMTISLIYELVFLLDTNVLNYLVLAPRTTFFSANREGIVSFLGYCSIFLWGQTAGFFLLGNVPTVNNLYRASVVPVTLSTSITNKKKRNPQRNKLKAWDRFTSVSPLKGLFIWTFIFLVLSQFITSIHPYDVSRRFANLPYTVWVITYNMGFILVFCLVDKLFGNNGQNYNVPLTLEAINSNGLLMFLLSNVSTGLINMSITTIDCSDTIATLILLAYAATMAIISIVLYKFNIIIKL